MTPNHVPIKPPGRTDRLESLEDLCAMAAGAVRGGQDTFFQWCYPDEDAEFLNIRIQAGYDFEAGRYIHPGVVDAVQTGELAAFVVWDRQIRTVSHGTGRERTTAGVDVTLNVDVARTRVDRGDFAKWLWCNHHMLPEFLREFAAELDAPPMDRAESPQAQRWENTTQAMFYALAEHHGYLKSGDFKDAAKRIAKALQTSGHDFDPRTVEDRLMGGCVKTAEKGRRANSPDK